MKNINISILLLILSLPLKLAPDTRMVIYLKHAPENALNAAEQDARKENLLKKLELMDKNIPSQNATKNMRNYWRNMVKPKLSGFIAIYSGYWDYSDIDGLISFPLRHVPPKVYLAITTKFNLLKVKGNTFSHKEFLDEPTPTKLYLFEKKEDAKKMQYWQVSEQKIPTDKKINPLTVTILSHPDNIVIPIGDFMSNDNVQIVLPDIYVISNKDNEKIIMESLDITRFFEHINMNNKKTGDFTIQKMISNM